MTDLVRIRSFPSRIEAESAQATLAAAGIDAIVTADDASGWRPGPSFVAGAGLSVPRAEAARAVQVLRALEPPSRRSELPASWRWQRWGLVCVGSGLAALVLAGSVADSLPRALAYACFALAIGLMVTGVTLIVIGPRRDRVKLL